MPVDLAANAESLGAKVYRPKGIDEFNDALVKAKKNDQTSVIYVETVRDRKLDGYSYSWWEVPVPEISISEDVKKARKKRVKKDVFTVTSGSGDYHVRFDPYSKQYTCDCMGFWRVKDKKKGCKHIIEVRNNNK